MDQVTSNNWMNYVNQMHVKLLYQVLFLQIYFVTKSTCLLGKILKKQAFLLLHCMLIFFTQVKFYVVTCFVLSLSPFSFVLNEFSYLLFALIASAI